MLANDLRTGGLSGQAIEETGIRSVLVNDLDGQPFYWLTIRGPKDSADFWAAAAQADTPVTATGATTDRNLLAFEFGPGFADRLLALRARLGDVELVSPQGQVIYATHAGRTYDVQTGQEVSAEQLKRDHEVYAELKAGYLKDTAAQQALHEAWAQVGEEMGALSSGSVDGQGNLVAGQALLATPARGQGEQLSAQTSLDQDPADWGFLNRIKSRAGIAGSGLNGYVAMKTHPQQVASWKALQTADLGNEQQANSYPYYQTLPPEGKWGMRLFNPFNGQIANWEEYGQPVGARLGCVPTAVIRAIGANALAGGKSGQMVDDLRTALGWNGYDGINEAVQKMRRKASEPVQADSVPAGYYEPRISQMMGAGEFEGGTLVTPHGFGDGIQSVLNILLGQGKYRTEGVIKAQIPMLGGMESSPTFDFNSYTRLVRDAVRRGINEDGNSVMFLYSSGGGGGHMSISHAYRAYEYVGGYTDVFLFMSGQGNYSGTDGKTYNGQGDPYVRDWINVTNRWSAYSGAVAIRKN
ncbi:hypothetical protein [Deinococcus sp. YIM 77859]|uniref:hypothetical protein n=1 Tax=Deinococcus sp. YIM 77859 TaxID=1540221 RepID=UPI0012E0B1F3|nr:hypothetical protein [Deinococcus sp. YIM 77859]